MRPWCFQGGGRGLLSSLVGAIGSAALSEAVAFAAFLKKRVGFVFDPFNEPGHCRVVFQQIDGGVDPGQLTLCEQCVDLTMTDAMEHDGLHTTV